MEVPQDVDARAKPEHDEKRGTDKRDPESRLVARRRWRRRERGLPDAAVLADRRGWPGLRPAM